MGIIIDTSIWIDVERGNLAPADIAEITKDEPVYVTPPVIAELEYGIYRAKTEAQKNKRLSAVNKIKRKPCLIIDRETGDIFGKIASDLDNSGKSSSYMVQDVWIAALAIQHNFRILTRNLKDFEGITGLEILSIGNSGK